MNRCYKVRRPLWLGVLVTLVALGPLAASAQIGAESGGSGTKKTHPSKDIAEGQILKIDLEAGKVTIKHGDIRSVGMPPMTMVFPVKDKSMLGGVKSGDKINFKVVRETGHLVVTDIQLRK
jgi:Cu/Ag efflux protein CusF